MFCLPLDRLSAERDERHEDARDDAIWKGGEAAR